MEPVTVVHIPEPLRKSPSKLAATFDRSTLKPIRLYLLDEDWEVVRAYEPEDGRWERVKAASWEEGDVVALGGAAAEAVAANRGYGFVEEREARTVVLEEGTGRPQLDLLRRGAAMFLALRGEVSGLKTTSEEFEGTYLAVLPGNISRIGAWACVVGLREVDGAFDVLLRVHVHEDLSVAYEDVRWDALEEFEGWWQPPWSKVAAVGKNLKRRVEALLERPVVRVPPKLYTSMLRAVGRSHPRDVLVAEKVAEWSREVEPSPTSPPSRLLVLLPGELSSKPCTACGIVVERGEDVRRVVARAYLDEGLKVSSTEGCKDLSEIEWDLALAPSRELARYAASFGRKVEKASPTVLKLIALLSPRVVLLGVRLEDYAAIKVVRWFEVSSLLE